jgi:hypothetical protein
MISDSSVATDAFLAGEAPRFKLSGSGLPLTRGGGELLSELASLEAPDPLPGETDVPLLRTELPALTPRLHVEAESPFDGVALGVLDTGEARFCVLASADPGVRPPNLPPRAAVIGTAVYGSTPEYA